MEPEGFVTDYESCRDRWLAAAARAGAEVTQLSIAARGPAGGPLFIDVAWLGAPGPRRALLHFAGVHGVEGFAGSAIQRRILEQPPPAPADAALVLVHAVNPYGMAWLRRVNENNVDLNRNFLGPDEPFRGAPPLYHEIDTFLNPAGPPQPDGFILRAGWNLLRHGFGPLKEAIARGQYDYPRGLFYGGRELEPGPRQLSAWLPERLGGARVLAAIDVHTGLGRRGADMLLVPETAGSTRFAELRRRLGPAVTPMHQIASSYRITGGIHEGVMRLAPQADWTWVTQEFGTISPLFVLASLRAENRWHHFGAPAQLDHPAKQQLVRAFCPGGTGWRQKLVARGTQLFRQMSQIVAGTPVVE